MTAPVQEPSTDRALQAFAYQRDQIFRRPAPAAGASNISATAVADSRSLANTGALALQFRYIFTNDASFSYAVTSGGSPNRATYLTISQTGFYMAHFVAYWNTNFTAGDNPFIQPSCYFVDTATPDVLVNSDGLEAWDDTQDGIWGIQLAAAEMTYHSLRNVFFFNFDPAVWGTASLGLGITIKTSVARTKFYGGQLTATWLGDLVEQVTIT
jgi:hypothetical protein